MRNEISAQYHLTISFSSYTLHRANGNVFVVEYRKLFKIKIFSLQFYNHFVTEHIVLKIWKKLYFAWNKKSNYEIKISNCNKRPMVMKVIACNKCLSTSTTTLDLLKFLSNNFLFTFLLSIILLWFILETNIYSENDRNNTYLKIYRRWSNEIHFL